jgi:hypothetical protein
VHQATLEIEHLHLAATGDEDEFVRQKTGGSATLSMEKQIFWPTFEE